MTNQDINVRCTNDRCPSKNLCFRFVEPPLSPYYWNGFFSLLAKEDRCENYLPNDRAKVRIMLKLDSDA